MLSEVKLPSIPSVLAWLSPVCTGFVTGTCHLVQVVPLVHCLMSVVHSLWVSLPTVCECPFRLNGGFP